MTKINWCALLDGIAWSYDSKTGIIWGHDTEMLVSEINERIDKRVENVLKHKE